MTWPALARSQPVGIGYTQLPMLALCMLASSAKADKLYTRLAATSGAVLFLPKYRQFHETHQRACGVDYNNIFSPKSMRLPGKENQLHESAL